MKRMNDDPEIMAWISERCSLVTERISSILTECVVSGPFDVFFKQQAEFILYINEIYKKLQDGSYESLSAEELKKINRRLYQDIYPENYKNGFADPSYACACMGLGMGRLLSWLASEVRRMIGYAFDGSLEDMTAIMELLVEVYTCFEEGIPEEKEISQIIYWYVSDYSDLHRAASVRAMIDPSFRSCRDMIMKADLSDLSYLYRYGACITENEIRMAQYMNSLDQSVIDDMARTFVEGYVRGFEVYKIDLSEKKTVSLWGNIGFERVFRSAVRMFADHGLETIIRRDSIGAVPVNPQYSYDHRYDEGLYLDKALCERMIGVSRSTFDDYRELAAVYGGPAVMEIFGEEPFEPEDKEANVRLSDKQQSLHVMLQNKLAEVSHQYIDPNKRSFTIISWPIPSIGDQFEEIFRDTIRVNNLDNDLYRSIQQKMIDAMDGASYARVLGMNGNRTDIKVSLWQLKDPEKETVFENCCADVNIPVGEVFTSPVLAGTEGILNVSSVYLNGLNYKNLSVTFKDGLVTACDCDNYDTEEKNQKYLHQNLLKSRPTLPMGEFAIGTNTTAYTMARKYGISAKMPILIMEKTGPHFAIGDTCYSYAEDHKVYNQDGKEIVARENERSAQRSTKPEEAYFNVHTDITVPYNELGLIKVVFPDGRETEIIRNGRFVLPGTELLNEALED